MEGWGEREVKGEKQEEEGKEGVLTPQSRVLPSEQATQLVICTWRKGGNLWLYVI